jgi:hypothetical protein
VHDETSNNISQSKKVHYLSDNRPFECLYYFIFDEKPVFFKVLQLGLLLIMLIVAVQTHDIVRVTVLILDGYRYLLRGLFQ